MNVAPIIALPILVLMAAPPVAANPYIWTNGAPSNLNWSAANNWSPGLPPKALNTDVIRLDPKRHPRDSPPGSRRSAGVFHLGNRQQSQPQQSKSVPRSGSRWHPELAGIPLWPQSPRGRFDPGPSSGLDRGGKPACRPFSRLSRCQFLSRLRGGSLGRSGTQRSMESGSSGLSRIGGGPGRILFPILSFPPARSNGAQGILPHPLQGSHQPSE